MYVEVFRNRVAKVESKQLRLQLIEKIVTAVDASVFEKLSAES